MDIFCIITNVEKDEDFKITNTIKDYLTKHNKKYFLAVNENSELYRKKGFMSPSEIPEEVQCALVLGGDGTMILAANDLFQKDIPIIGVNLGTLGFLTEIEKKDIFITLDALFEGRYMIEHRLMLSGSVFCDQKNVYNGNALNDIVISRQGTSGLISVKVYVNDELLNTYLGDGIILSTPTGSTGYNLSAGGPVAIPNSNSIIITPICPHTLNNRSVILNAEDKIRVELGKRTKKQEEAVVILDGRERIKLQTGDVIEITKALKDTKLVKVRKKSIFELLRTKLGEGKE